MLHKKYLTILAVLVCLQTVVPAQECAIGLQDTQKGMHVVMENCKSIGTFSLGGIYEGGWEKLTYYYPLPWAGTFITIKVNDKTYVNSIDPRDGIKMDQYVTQPPTVEGDKITVKWMLPENVYVEENLELIDNSTLIHLRIRNDNPGKALNLGARLHLDTMLGDNDGAPIYVPGEGLKETEEEYSGKDFNFKYWKAYNRKDKPDIVSTGILDGKLTYPDRLVIANWKKSTRTAWDYAPQEGTSVLGDSAVILYYYPAPVASGQTRDILTGYGSGEPVLKKISEITEIVLDNITGEYCMGQDVIMKVDVGSRIEMQGEISLEILNNTGDLQYSKKTSTGVVKAESVKSIKFTYRVPQDAFYDQYNVTATLYDGLGNNIDAKSTKFTVNATKCTGVIKEEEEPAQGPNWVLLGLLLLIIIAAVIFVLSRAKGEVLVKKVKQGDRVVVSAFNNSEEDLRECVLEDRIPEGAEVDISTLHVRRRHTRLVLDVGALKAGQKATMEYRIRGVNVVPKAIFKWEGGEKLSQ